MSSMTGAQVIAAARDLNGDNGTNNIWEDSDYMEQLDRFIKFIRAEYPESQLNDKGTGVVDYSTAETDASKPLALDGIYFSVAVQYVCWRYFGADSGDSRDEVRSKAHKAAMDELLKPVG